MTAANAYHIKGGGLRAEILDVGASLRDLRLDGIGHPLVLGLADLAHYPEYSPHMGAIAGRVANRIEAGAFVVDGVACQGPRNLADRDMLHGGPDGFGTQRWSVESHSTDHIRLQFRSPAGEAGFPGNLEARCEYRCTGDGRLAVYLTATTDATTLVNLAPHSYFNLSGEPTINTHMLTVHADTYTELSDHLMPTGEINPAAGRYDFRQPRQIGEEVHDENYCLANDHRTDPVLAACLSAGGITLHVHTTEPGLQVYTGDNLQGDAPGLNNRENQPRAGICLESQAWPDAPHHSNFPDISLHPGEQYQHHTVYHFER
jgi:aldose 1-epimerase